MPGASLGARRRRFDRGRGAAPAGAPAGTKGRRETVQSRSATGRRAPLVPPGAATGRHRGGGDGRLLRSRRLRPEGDHLVARGATLVRSRPELDLCVQPGGGGPLLPPRGRGRSRLCDGLVGARVRARPLLQPDLGEVRRGGAREGAAGRLRRGAGGAGAPRRREPSRTGAHRRDRAAPSFAGAAGRLPRLERRLRGRDARSLPGLPPGSGSLRPVRGRPHEPHPVEALGPAQRGARRGRRHPGGAGGAGGGVAAEGRGGGGAPPGPAPLLHPP